MFDTSKLPQKVKDLLTKSNNEIYVSSISIWEIILKKSLHKTKGPSYQELVSLRKRQGFHSLPLAEDDPALLENLPFLHKDPFDRIIICQALNNCYT